MPKKTDVSLLLMRIQEEINIEDVTPSILASWLSQDRRGMSLGRRRLATQLSNIIQKERQITLSFTIGERFAMERKIKLTDKVVANVYNKWGRYGRKAVVIFDQTKGNRIKAWRYV